MNFHFLCFPEAHGVGQAHKSSWNYVMGILYSIRLVGLGVLDRSRRPEPNLLHHTLGGLLLCL